MRLPVSLLTWLCFLHAALSYNQSAPYSDSFARSLFILAGSAYSETPEICVQRIYQNSSVVRVVSLPCDDKNQTCSAYVSLLEADRAIAISFRGTHGMTQLTTEFDHLALDHFVDFEGYGTVAAYFKHAFDSVWDHGVKQTLQELTDTHPGYELWLTGHSLGGSMAALGAMYIYANHLFDPSRVKLVTFGQPRTGDSTFSAAVNEHIPYSFRVVHLRDVVPHAPPMLFGYTGYTHHKQEVFYPNDMDVGSEYKVCGPEEDPTCSSAYSYISPMDHFWYFNLYYSDPEDHGCPRRKGLFGRAGSKFRKAHTLVDLKLLEERFATNGKASH